MANEKGWMMRYYCTYFDHRYLDRGLALYRSLKAHTGAFELSILCLNDLCFETLSRLNLPFVKLVQLEVFEKRHPELSNAKQNRSLVEYYFTCTPVWMQDVLNQNKIMNLLTYLDADLFFFSNPEPIYQEMGSNSIAIIPHRFSARYQFLEEYGLFNVGWVSARRDPYGLECLSRWKEQCLEWCYDVLEKERFADQKYLDEWPLRYQGHLAVVQHPGANLAPWNVLNYQVSQSADHVLIDGTKPLIFYHFHKLKILKPWLFNPNFLSCGLKSFNAPLKSIYQPYLQSLFEIQKNITRPIQETGCLPLKPFRPLKSATHSAKETTWGKLITFIKSLPAKQYVFFIRGNVC